MWQAETEVESGCLGRREWSTLIAGFSDASIYQSWAYGSESWGVENLRHVVVRRAGAVIAVAQARIARLAPFGTGLAYLPWGPLVRRRQGLVERSTFDDTMIALRRELVERDGFSLRVLPPPFDVAGEVWDDVMRANGFYRQQSSIGYRTVVVDLTVPEDALRESVRSSWRRNLKRAEAEPLEIVASEGDALFDRVAALHEEMQTRKGIAAFVSVDGLRRVQQALEPDESLRVAVAQSRAGDHAAVICSAIGDTGVFLLGATSPSGRASRASYLLHWDAMNWLRARGRLRYDLGGIASQQGDRVQQFKRGLLGPHAWVQEQSGPFDTATGAVGSWLLHSIDRARTFERSVQRRLASLRSRIRQLV